MTSGCSSLSVTAEEDRASRRETIAVMSLQVARRNRVSVGLVAAIVGLAFADSSIVVLALPQLYGQFHTSIEGVSWVLTAYNVAVAASALALVLFVHRVNGKLVLAAGLVLFFAASIASSAAGGLAFLIAARSVQGGGAALLLAGSLPMLVALTGSASAGAAVWTLAGTFGAALGPALGGALTQVFDWRAIFIAQAPAAGLALIGGAAIVSVLPAATLAVRPLERRLPPLYSVCGGASVLSLGLVALALIPSPRTTYVLAALAFCGAGLGLSIPILSDAALNTKAGLARSGTLSVGMRHLG